MNIPEHLRDLWNAFCATRAIDPTPRFLEAFHFDDNEPSANELAALVLSGKKQATASLLCGYELDHQPLPQAGDLSIVTDFAGKPVCIIETRLVETVPFDEVTAQFAAIEGEGDGSLAYWRDAHEDFFARECQRLGLTPDARMPVVCEQFQVVFKSAAGLEREP